MKVKVICFLMLLSLVGSVCYAEDTVTIGSEPTSSGPAAVVVEALEDMSRETYTDYVESILDWLSPGDLITMRADALHSYFSISEDRFFFETETLSDEKRQALSDVLLSLYDAVTQYGTRVENEDKILEIGRSIGNSSECENVLSISFTDSATGERVKWDVTDEGAFVPWGYYETDKADKIIAAVENAVLAHKEVLLNYRVSTNLSNVDLSSENVEVIERLTFEIPLNESNGETFFHSFGEVGDRLQCSVEQVSVDTEDLFLLRIENKGGIRETLYTVVSGLDFGSGNSGNSLEFTTSLQYDGSDFIRETFVGGKKATISISGSSGGKQVTDVHVSIDSRGMGESVQNMPAENIHYEFLGDDTTLNSRRNLYVLFGIEKEDLIKDEEDDPEKEQEDPDISTTNMRGEYLDGEEVIDFYISFIGEADITVNTASAPDWFQKLGSNVKATIVGVTQTLNGEDRRSYTMLRFSGDQGIQWFDNNETNPEFDAEKNEYAVYNSFNSLLSFNGFQKVRNTQEYDTASATMYFNNDEDRTLKSITFDIGNASAEVQVDDIKYIGGGKIAYEKLW